MLLSLFCFRPALADGDLIDPGFGEHGIALIEPDGVTAHQFRVNAAATQADGKLLFAGTRNFIDPQHPDPRNRAIVARMNADGTADASFGGDPSMPGVATLRDIGPGAEFQAIEAMQTLADGSIVVAGTAMASAPLTGFVAKLDASGAPDVAFGSNGMVFVDGAYLHALAVDADGRIVVAGETAGPGVMNATIFRFNADGTVDATFGTGGRASPSSNANRYSYLNAIVALTDGSLIAGGFHEAEAPEVGDMYWVAKLDGTGAADPSFGTNGSSLFRMPGSASTFNAIQKMLVVSQDVVVFAGYYMTDFNGTSIVFGRLLPDGHLDAAFGDPATPGIRPLSVLPDADDRYVGGLVQTGDGKLLASILYASAQKQTYAVVRTLADGVLDADFANGGLFEADLAPDDNAAGVFSSSTALTLQNGHPIVAGSVRPSAASSIVDIAAIRLFDDRLFTSGFETEGTGYDALAEGFIDTAFHYDGVTYRGLNNVSGAYPDGNPMSGDELGHLFIVENAGLFYADFPDFGSAPNALTFGKAYMPGDNLTIGALSSAWLDLDSTADEARMAIAFYENGAWGGIEIHLDAYRDGAPVASDTLTLSGADPGRDNVATATLAVAGAEFDALHLYATLDGVYTAPRLLIDDVELVPATLVP